MGNRVDLTPYDIKSISDAYKCADHCKSRGNTPTCVNGGFLLKDCTCMCPKGLGGRDCSITDPTWSSCGGIFDVTDPAATYDLETPNFPNPYSAGDKCAWMFKTSRKNSLIELRVIHLDTHPSWNHCYDAVEVRKNLPIQKGIRLCGSKSKGTFTYPLYTLTTKLGGERQIVVLFTSADFSIPQSGFKAAVRLVPITACMTSNCTDLEECVDNGSPSTYYCTCKPGLKGANCDEVGNVTITEDFEKETHLFTGWIRNAGPTPSSSTGPTADHTTGKGSYMYYETSSPVKSGDTLTMASAVEFKGNIERCMQFFYHMNGAAMGSFEVFINDTHGVQEKLFTKSGDHGYMWIEAKIVIPRQNTDMYKIVFVGTKGGDFTSDMAVDDITVSPCNNPPEPTPKRPQPTTKAL